MSALPPSAGPDGWHARAPELADWALARFFPRTDRFGAYYVKSVEDVSTVCKCAKPTEGAVPNVVHRGLLLRHFRATSPSDVIGSYHLAPEPKCFGRVVSVDVDAHDASADPDRNEMFAKALYARLEQMGFRPLLATWGGGSYHLHALFSENVEGSRLYEFGRALVSDASAFGFTSPVEAFPKQPSVPVGGFGNWLRLVGRHHTRPVWASVWNGESWLEGAFAVAHLLTLTGDSPDLIPQVHEKRETRAEHTPQEKRDVFAEYNRAVPIDEVCRWHEQKGHRATKKSAHRVEFVRGGKKSGESFNVALIDGVPITFNFSCNAGLPERKGMNPAQVRCFYLFGATDRDSMAQLAEVLRAELGWVEPARAPLRDVHRPDTVEGRLAALEKLCGQLIEQNRELANALCELRERKGGCRVW